MVTGDGRRFKSALEMAEITAELKEYAKSFAGNNFVKEEDLTHGQPDSTKKT